MSLTNQRIVRRRQMALYWVGMALVLALTFATAVGLTVAMMELVRVA